MNLVIKINDESYAKTYVAIFMIGLLECIEKGSISIEDSMWLLFGPGEIDIFKPFMPELSEAIHLGTELEDVASIIPNKLEDSIEEIRKKAYEIIKLNPSSKQNVFYEFK